MDQIKTTTETIIAYGNDTWENLGDVTMYYRDSYGQKAHDGSATLLYKTIPGLGIRFKVIYKDKVYALEKNTTVYYKNECNAYIGILNRYLNVEGYE